MKPRQRFQIKAQSLIFSLCVYIGKKKKKTKTRPLFGLDSVAKQAQ
jgi:hypothetical protein